MHFFAFVLKGQFILMFQELFVSTTVGLVVGNIFANIY